MQVKVHTLDRDRTARETEHGRTHGAASVVIRDHGAEAFFPMTPVATPMPTPTPPSQGSLVARLAAMIRRG